MIRGVCFDMDGVLFDTERLGSRIMCVAASLQGEEMTDRHWRALIGSTMQQTVAQLNVWFPRLDAEQFIRDWKREQLDWVSRNGVPLKPGAAEALETLQAEGIRLSLCTSNDPDVVETYLRLTGWEHTFRPVVTRLMIDRPKPAPDCYLKAAALMGLTPGECAGVEDSPTGIQAVRAAGMLSVMIPDVIPYTESIQPAIDHLLPDLHAFMRLISEINHPSDF
ncbi:MAG: HAD family phosphatase [Clostridia bacterium]|nr:HAD family phosphatase [Clostridia bacterium]